jgi:hypothetical protein
VSGTFARQEFEMEIFGSIKRINIKFIIIKSLIIFSIISCEKRGNDINTLLNKNNIQQNIENKETVSQSIDKGNTVQQEIEDQKVVLTDITEKNLILEITEDIKAHLLDYFPDGNYQVLEKLLDVKYRKIIFAVHCIKKLHFDYKDDDVLICDTIVGFEIIDGSFQRYLLIKDFQFVNIDDTILIDFSKGYDRIYGFNILYSYPKAAGYNPGLVIGVYFDNGNRVADSFTISWNEDKKKFEKVKFR